MKFTRRDVTRLLALPVIFHATKTAIAPARASLNKDPAFREAVQAAMLEYIDAAKIKGHSLIFDPVKGDFVKARFKKLHKNLSLVADSFYVSCADYETEEGDMRDGQLRNQHMEDAKIIFANTGGCCAAKFGAGCGAGCAPSCGTKCGAAS